MTTGTTANYNDTRNDIISDALTILGAQPPDEAVNARDLAVGIRYLSRLVKAWEGTGAHIWTDEVARVWLQDNTREYLLGGASSDAHWAIDYVETDLTAALADNATTASVTSTTGMTVGDKIGIVMSDNGVHWTTIATIPGATSLTLTAGVTETCASGAYVYTYTTRPQRPLRILDAGLVSGILLTENQRELGDISFSELHLIQNKLSNGPPNLYNYKAKLDSGVLSVWQVPTDCSSRISIHYQRPMFDFDSGTDTPDIPPQWLEAIIYGLAARLAPVYGKIDMLPSLMAMATTMFNTANEFDSEITSIYISPSEDR